MLCYVMNTFYFSYFIHNLSLRNRNVFKKRELSQKSCYMTGMCMNRSVLIFLNNDNIFETID